MTRTITTDPGAPPPACFIHGTPMKSKGLYRGRARWLCEITHKVDINPDLLRPWCPKCRRPLRKAGNARSPSWACKGCGTCMVRRRQRRPPTHLKRPSRYQMQMPVELIARPICLGCHREMWIKVANGRNRKRRNFNWTCNSCNVSIVVVSGRLKYLPHLLSRPNCPRCSSPMYRGGKARSRPCWICKSCRVYTTRPEAYRSLRDTAGRPPCQRCSRTLCKVGKRHGRQRWLCPGCRRVTIERPIPVLHTPPRVDDAAALDLLAALSAQLPGHLLPEEREDAKHDLLVAVLEGSIGAAPTPWEVRRAARAARSLIGDRFKFVSLDAPIPGTDGLTRAETLIG